MSDELSPDAAQDTSRAETQSHPPGLTLRAAREARGLSQSEVAQVTRFSVRQIEALENDDYAALPGSTVVRGFVRAYAKLLKLDAEPLLAGLDSAAPMTMADVRPPTQVGEVKQLTWRQRIKPGRVATLSLWSLLLLAVVWYIARPDLEMLRRHLTGASPTAEPSSTHATGSTVLSSQEASSVPAPVASPEATVTASAAPVMSAEPSATSVLHLAFDELSWIEISDATGQVIFRGEYPAGTRQDVTGQPPFQVWIGKASGVRLSYGDRSIDLQPYTRADVARLTVE